MAEVPDKFKEMQKEWKYKELAWTLVHFILGVSSAMAAALVALASDRSPVTGEWRPYLSGFAAATAAALTILSPSARRKAYTEARNLLRVTRFRFEHQGDTAVSELANAVEKAQDIIARR